jgi:hypothetical protein
MHYYQFHIGDYKSHTHHLSLMEDLAYRRLLDHYYLHQLPIKQREIARQIGMRDHEQEVLTVLEEFFVSTEDGYINPRADKEIRAYVEHQATSAYGAFIRDNPTLKPIADKHLFITHYMDGKVQIYVDFLRASCVVDVPIVSTSSSNDATINHKPITNNQEPNKKATVVAAPEGVSIEVWKSFVEQRKKARAVITDLVISQIRSEAEKIGWTLEQAMSECVARGWRGFKADWIKPKAVDIAKQTVPSRQGRDPVLVKIDEESKLAVPPSLEVLEKMAQLRGVK